MTTPYVERFEALAHAGVRYVVVGGLAVVFHGVPRMTFDLDLALDPDAANMANVVTALLAQGYRPRIPEPLERLADPVIRRAWRQGRNMVAFNVHHGSRRLEDVDLLLLEPEEWSVLYEDAERRSVGAVEISVVSRRALIAMKRASGRPQDLADALALESLPNA